MKLRVLLLAVVIASSAAQARSIEKWIDAEGNIHYGQAAPQGVGSTRVPSPPSASSVSGSTNADAEHSVVLYATRRCGYCKKARAYMRRNGIEFREFDIERNRLARREYDRLGGRGVPLLVRGDARMTGFSTASYQRFFASD